MLIQRFFFSLLALAALSACSKFKRLTDNEKITEVTIGAENHRDGRAGRTTQSGGVFVWAVSANGEKFSFFLATETAFKKVTLKTGEWTFHAAGWTGNFKFEGAVRCGTKVVTIAGTAMPVEIGITASGCGASFFGPASFKDTNEPLPIRAVTCVSLGSVTNGAANCNSGARGTLRSFQVKLVAYDTMGIGENLSSALESSGAYTSACYNLDAAGGNSIADNILAKIPVGDGSGSSPIHTVISGYTVPGCGSGEKQFSFPNGIYAGSTPSVSTKVYPDTTRSAVFLAHSTLGPAPTVTAVNPSIIGLVGGQTLTITGTNFYNSTITVGTYTCTSPNIISTTSLTCTAPVLSSGSHAVVVTNDDGQVSTNFSITARFTTQQGVAGVSTRVIGTAVDSTGNVLIAGTTFGDLRGEFLNGTSDAFVSKFSASGQHLWTHLIGVSGAATEATAFEADAYGDMYVTGNTDGSLPGNSQAGPQDAFVVKLSSAGAPLHTIQLGAVGVTTTSRAVSVDGSGNFAIGGYSTGSLDSQPHTGSEDLFVTKWDNAGNKVWTEALGGDVSASAHVHALALRFDGNGNLYVAGETDDDLDGETKAGLKDAFLSQYDVTVSPPNLQWTRLLGVASKTTYATGVTVGDGQDAFITGSTNGALPGNTLTGTTDAFVTRIYSVDGTPTWTTQFGESGEEVRSKGIAMNAVESAGHIYITGTSTGGLDGTPQIGSSYDFFVASLSHAGVKIESTLLGVSAADTFASSIGTTAASSVETVYVGGYTTGDFDGNSLTGTDDAFVAKFDSDLVKQ